MRPFVCRSDIGMTRKKLAIRVFLGLLVLWLGVVAWGFVSAWRPLPEYMPATQTTPAQPILSAEDVTP